MNRNIVIKMIMIISIIAGIVLIPAMATGTNPADYILSLIATDSGIELEEIITLSSSLLATALFIISFIAYRRDGRKRLLFVTIAFFLFAVKGFLSASDLFFSERDWVDPVASFLDFAILLCFFFGILKK